MTIKSASERRKEYEYHSHRNEQRSIAVAELLERIIDTAVHEGRDHLSITPNLACMTDKDFPMVASDETYHNYFYGLAEVYRKHGFAVTPIQDTDCGFDDCLYRRGFDLFW